MNDTNIEIRRSSRKTLAIEITKDAKVIVRAPYAMPTLQIKRFVEEKSDWIDAHISKLMEKQANRLEESVLTEQQLRKLTEEACVEIPKRVAYFAPFAGVSYGKITIRRQRTRWGSCSSKGNLNFNCLLMLAPPEVLDYVVVHELCHRKEMNHSVRFWREVEKILPDYRSRKQWLKENGNRLIESRS